MTLEPCPMCIAGAIMNSRFSRLVYGASDEKARVSLIMCANSSVTLHLTIMQRLHPGFAVKTALNCCRFLRKEEKKRAAIEEEKLQALQLAVMY